MTKLNYSLESKIENITTNTYYNVDNVHDGRKFFYQDCNVTTCNNYCMKHKELFINKCGYKSLSTEKYCINIADKKSKYCKIHSEYGKYCNDKYCRNIRIENNKVCFIHS